MHFSIFNLLLLASAASAHFVLNYPGSLGFDDDNEPNAPCGGEDVTFNDNITTVPVGGFPVALLTTHPQAQFLYRGTLDKQAPFNWTNLLPVVNEQGLGDFCLPNMQVPMNWANQSGLLQIIMDGPDGILYQCAALNFTSGVNSTVDHNSCQNGSSVTATVTTDSNFTSTGGSSTSSSAPATTSSGATMQNKGSLLAASLGLAIAGFGTL